MATGQGRQGQCRTRRVGDGYLLKPSPSFVAGLTLEVGIAKASAVLKIGLKQFRAIPLAGKVVAGPCVMTMPPCVHYRVLGPRSRTGERRSLMGSYPCFQT